MGKVRSILAGLLVVVAGCSVGSDPASTSLPAATTSSTTPSTTSSVPAQDVQIQDCSAPPVTFSALCEIYELVQEWHVDRPIADSRLASAALEALIAHEHVETETPPRTLFCAVPGDDFTELCDQLGQMISEDQVAVGPALEEAVLAMTDIGLDQFTYYVPPDQVGTFRETGVVGGVGILLDATNAVGSKCARLSETCPLEIVFVLEGNPGAEAGLLAGDEIVSIDGVPVEGQGFASTATAIAGDETGEVDIAVSRNGSLLEFEVERAPLDVPTVEVALPSPDVGYLRIPDFEDDITVLVDDAMGSLVEFAPTTIVIDLRDNPGGFVTTAIDVASYFMDGGVVMETFAQGEQLDYTASSGGLATTQRLIVLVNKGTASAAEVLAGALRDQRSASIVGTTTFGKDVVQIPFPLRNGGELYVAVARWSTPAGLTAGNGGLMPDRQLELPADLSVEELVEAALAAAS